MHLFHARSMAWRALGKVLNSDRQTYKHNYKHTNMHAYRQRDKETYTNTCRHANMEARIHIYARTFSIPNRKKLIQFHHWFILLGVVSKSRLQARLWPPRLYMFMEIRQFDSQFSASCSSEPAGMQAALKTCARIDARENVKKSARSNSEHDGTE